MSQLSWQKSSYSEGEGSSNCLELATGAGDARHLRESDDPDTVITTNTAKLHAFILGAKAGEFDHLLSSCRFTSGDRLEVVRSGHPHGDLPDTATTSVSR
ncbi:DUF397 domain-containing protein, partial [Kitasatospora sp. NPDC088548]|uniref:DUF397 domain-containing protein n=1 Tax=Kitasatospora sp. NPDC088548 TaxID=3364075 RepID=UPI003801FCD5